VTLVLGSRERALVATAARTRGLAERLITASS
jgi:hypothetical protein